MKRVFQRNDVVYHYVFGMGTVSTVDPSQFSSSPYYIHWYNDVKPNGWFPEKELSFKPWPEPVHVRPFNKGWYVLLLNDKSYKVEYLTKALDEEVKLVHFFGARMPEGLK